MDNMVLGKNIGSGFEPSECNTKTKISQDGFCFHLYLLLFKLTLGSRSVSRFSLDNVL